MLFSQGNVEEACAPPLRRSPLEAAALPRFVSGALTHFDRTAPRRPPTLLLRTLVVTLAMVVTILLSVFLVLILDLRARVRGEVADVLETDRTVLVSAEARRGADAAARLAVLTANPTFEAALQKHDNTYGGFTPLEIRQSMAWLETQLRPIADGAGATLAAMLDARGVTMAQGGAGAAEWPERPGIVLPRDGEALRENRLRVGRSVYLVTSRPVFLGRQRVATLCVARRLDRSAADAISEVTRAHTLLRVEGETVGSTLDAAATRALQRTPLGGAETGEVQAAGEWYAWHLLFSSAGVEGYALAPLGAPASRTTARAIRAVLALALGALVLAVVGSFWLAHRIAAPIDTMSRVLSNAVTAHDFDVRLEAGGGSRELEDLTRTFNELMAGLSKAEAESRSASLDAIEALAKALEARDVYTAGHSERVGELAVRLGRELGLAAGELEVLRLGASLHDIGKIGVTDLVLRKPGALTNDERRAIEVHPLVGARILRPVTSLAAHLPIVELHHERPDGRGYPHGLTGSAIPLPARIVHLADAYDAMTSDRPYRRGRPGAEAVLEIVRGRGTEFDADVVDAFIRAISAPSSCPPAAPSRPAHRREEDSVASCR